jgi:HSP20 family molecular chaperone IbpA
MKVEQQTTLDQQKKLQRQQKNIIAAKEEEINNLKRRFENQKNQIRSQTEAQINQEQLQARQRLLEANERAQNSLQKVQDQNIMQEKILTKERDNLVKNAAMARVDLVRQFQEDFQRRIDQGQQMNRTLDDRAKNQLQKIEGQVQNHIEKNKAQAAVKIYESDNLLQQRLNREEVLFNQTIDKQRRSFNRQVQEEQKTQKEILEDTQRKNKIALENERRTQNHQLRYVKNFYKNKLVQESESFQAKYDKQVSEHKSILQRLKEQFKNEVARFKSSMAQNKNGVISKAEDPFYKMTLFSPQIIDQPKSVQIDIKLQEHEVDNLQVNVQDKEINLSLTRRFDEQLEDNDGSINRSKRSEIVSKKFQLPTHLKEKSLTKHYHDGILSIRIEKDV